MGAARRLLLLAAAVAILLLGMAGRSAAHAFHDEVDEVRGSCLFRDSAKHQWICIAERRKEETKMINSSKIYPLK